MIAGELERPDALLERVVGYAHDVGLLPEEIEPVSAEQLRNFPQAFSLVGLIGGGDEPRSREEIVRVSCGGVL